MLFRSCWLWWLQSLSSRAVAIAELSLPSCCCCRQAVTVVVPSLSFCRRCCPETVDVVCVLLLCSLVLAGFDGCSHSPQGLLLMLLMLFFWKILTGPCSDIFLTAATTYSRSHDYKFAVLTLCRNYYLLLLWIFDWSHLEKQLNRNYNKLNG